MESELGPIRESIGEPSQSRGWFRAMRSTESLEVLKANPMAFILAYVIAYRSRYNLAFNQHALALGEAFLGDFQNYGMSQQQYRTAKKNLAMWQFATFRTTNRGTIGKLTDTRLFSVFRLEANEQTNNQATNSQQAANKQLTTNKISKNGKNEKKGESPPNAVSSETKKSLSSAERISYEGERVRIKERLHEIKNGASHTAWGAEYDALERTEIKRLKDRDAELITLLGCVV